MKFSNLRSQAAKLARSTFRTLAVRRAAHHPDFLKVFHDAQSSKSAAVDLADGLALFEAVKFRNPKTVLELGPGTSSAIIASALSPDATFIGIEQSQDWMDEHRKQFPGLFNERIELRHSPVAVTNRYQRPATYFTALPDRVYDFVHIDGPSHLDFGCDVTCDILNIVERLSPKCQIIFDGRQASARLAASTLRKLGFQMRWNKYSLNREFIRG